MSTLVVFLLLVADGGPPIGAITDAALYTFRRKDDGGHAS
jgi:hypothetical protein